MPENDLENVSDQKLQQLIDEAAERMVFGKENIAFGSAIQYRMLRAEQEERERKSGYDRQNVFLFEPPNY